MASQRPYAERVLKINHAGENGAVWIYTGQIFLARLTAPALVRELLEFRSHEIKHRAIFYTEMQRRGVPRRRSYALCGAGGLALGLVTGLLGRHAIAATTVAVERVVLRHLEHQMQTLRGQDEGAFNAISSIVTEERDHHDRSAQNSQGGGFWARLLSPLVAATTETVIWLGMRL